MRDVVHKSNKSLENLTKSINDEIENLHNKIELLSLIFIISIAIFLIISLLYISRIINKSLTNFKFGLDQFFF